MMASHADHVTIEGTQHTGSPEDREREDFPEEMTFALGPVRSMHFPRRWRQAEFMAVLQLAAL